MRVFLQCLLSLVIECLLVVTQKVAACINDFRMSSCSSIAIVFIIKAMSEFKGFVLKLTFVSIIIRN